MHLPEVIMYNFDAGHEVLVLLVDCLNLLSYELAKVF